MKLLEQTAREAKTEKQLEDVAVLHINHCMDNTFSFNDVLRSLFGHVTLVTPPYSNQDIPKGYPGPCYHGMRQDGAYRLMKDRTELGCGGTEFLEATLLLLEEAFRRELIPLLHRGKKLLIIEDGGYHFEALARVKRLFPEVEDRIVGVVEQTTSGTRRSMSRITAADQFGGEFSEHPRTQEDHHRCLMFGKTADRLLLRDGRPPCHPCDHDRL